MLFFNPFFLRNTDYGLFNPSLTAEKRTAKKQLTLPSKIYRERRFHMFNPHTVPLPKYSRREDIVNCATHAPGALFAVAALILCIVKLGASATGTQYAAVIIYSLCTFFLYSGSAIYHGLRPGFLKKIARLTDHSNVFLMITGSLSAYYLLGVIPVNRTLGIVLFTVSWVVTAAGILFTLMDQERFKVLQMILYMVLGWSVVISIKYVRGASIEGQMLFRFIIIGGIVYTVGAVLYGIGKKIPYIHAVFHIFILAGTVLQFYGIYTFAL